MLSNEGLKVVVIGAGTMGSGIAAHLANSGFHVALLDLTRESCQAAFEKAKAVKPPHFYGPQSLERVRLSGIDTDLDWVRDADWVCEAIIEKPEAKRGLYSLLEPLLPDHAIISTNTSGLEIGLLAEGRSPRFRERFLGTHFFNPPRYLKLLELIPTPETNPAEIGRVTEFLEERVGRRVVIAKDTPGFIANRFGMWAMFQATHVAEKLRLRIEDVDAMTGPFLGRPRSASFRLNDLVGLDIMVDIAANLTARCGHDPAVGTLQTPRSVEHLIANGAIGQKAGKGYYLREGKSFSVLDLETLLYRDMVETDQPNLRAIEKLPMGERIRQALQLGDDLGEFMRRYLVPTLQYAHQIREEISFSVEDFDRVMMWGFGWQKGPFAMIDEVGAENLGLPAEKFYNQGQVRTFSGEWIPTLDEIPYRSIDRYPVIEKGEGFQVHELTSGHLAVALTTKMGVITPALVRALTPWVAAQTEPFIFCSAARSFSVGYDLNFFLERSAEEDWDTIRTGLRELQDLADLLRTKRCIAAIHGHCLGAGFELAIACSQIVAHPETQIGLPEVKVGLLPGGSGTARMALGAQNSARGYIETCLRVSQGVVATSAAEAQALGYLRAWDRILLHPDALISSAAGLLGSVVAEFQPEWKLPVGPLQGMIDEAQKSLDFTRHDELIADKIKQIFCKSQTWTEALERERDLFIDLLQNQLTIARIKHMLESGKPLKN